MLAHAALATDDLCLSANCQDPEGKPKKANIRDNGNGTYTVSYVPDTTGRYTITIKYGGDEIPYSPYRIRALPAGDASKCLVTGQVLPPPGSPSFHQPCHSLSFFDLFPAVSIGGHGPGESSTCVGSTRVSGPCVKNTLMCVRRRHWPDHPDWRGDGHHRGCEGCRER